MEITLEHGEVERLLREALARRHVRAEGMKMTIRCNHKLGTIKIVFVETTK
jgi:hypothetical protein